MQTQQEQMFSVKRMGRVVREGQGFSGKKNHCVVTIDNIPLKEAAVKVRNELEKIFADIRDHQEMASFFEEIFTPKEIKDLELRWELLKELHAGHAQRSIAARHQISLCKITRGSKILKKPGSVTKKLLDKNYGSRQG